MHLIHRLAIPWTLLLLLLALPACPPGDDDDSAAADNDDSADDDDAADDDDVVDDDDVADDDDAVDDDDSAATDDDDSADDDDDSAQSSMEEDLSFIREEEKLARDVYVTLGDAYSLPVFGNIASSEQTHMDAVLGLLLARGIPDPIVDDSTGAFVNPVLDQLYDDLVLAGQPDVASALTVGATIEDLDIHDIEEVAAHTSDPGVLDVLDSLVCGSRNHMRAFYGQLQNRGEIYLAQFITEADLQAIVTSPHESCQ